MSETVTDTAQASRCINAAETRALYEQLRDSEVHGDGNPPCMRDDCRWCAPLNMVIDLRGADCESRGCTVNACIYDGPRQPD